MAVNQKEPAGMSASRRFGIGTNVVLSIALVLAIVVVTQMLAYGASARWDLTTTGVNSLSSGTVSLVENLDTNVRLTSLYFETDIDEEDQASYRRAVHDLLKLYEATNRSRIAVEWINPIKESDKVRKLRERLRALPAFTEAVAAHEKAVEAFKSEIAPQLQALSKDELDRIASVSAGIGAGSMPQAMAALQNVFDRLRQQLEATQKQVEVFTSPIDPQVGDAVAELRRFYAEISQFLNDVAEFARRQGAQPVGLSEEQAKFFREAPNRYAKVSGDIQAQITVLQDLEPMRLDDLFRQMGPTTNAILVETDKDATVVDFSSVWPPRDETLGLSARFEDRGFEGEEQVTSAILRTTHQEQTGVVFARYGGPPLFAEAFMPGQQQGLMNTMKRQLEKVNFMVKEWDLKATMTPPTFDPTPTKIIYVILRPTPPPAGPMGQPGSEPPFSESHKQAILKAVRESGRALFMAGWQPGPFGPIPSTYQFDEYLQQEWGIDVDSEVLLVEMVSRNPGEYGIGRQDFFTMDVVDRGEHIIVQNAAARDVYLPWCAPIILPAETPAGVELEPLLVVPPRDGVWGVHDLNDYQQQLSQREYMTREEDDLVGPFVVAVAGVKQQSAAEVSDEAAADPAETGDQAGAQDQPAGKVVVASTREFAIDNVAFAQEFTMGSQGLMVKSRNPGNVTFLINSLHWLNDNVQFMNVGQPIDASVLSIEEGRTERTVQALTIFGWPAVVLGLGGVVWLARRR